MVADCNLARVRWLHHVIDEYETALRKNVTVVEVSIGEERVRLDRSAAYDELRKLRRELDRLEGRRPLFRAVSSGGSRSKNRGFGTGSKGFCTVTTAQRRRNGGNRLLNASSHRTTVSLLASAVSFRRTHATSRRTFLSQRGRFVDTWTTSAPLISRRIAETTVLTVS